MQWSERNAGEFVKQRNYLQTLEAKMIFPDLLSPSLLLNRNFPV